MKSLNMSIESLARATGVTGQHLGMALGTAIEKRKISAGLLEKINTALGTDFKLQNDKP